jgi:hypothetical protein
VPDFRGHFEVHLTVRAESPHADAQFRAWCRDRGVKCVRIVLDRGATPDQPMATWRRSNTVLPTVRAEAERLAADLTAAGVPVTRVKIEVDPANEDVPAADAAGSANYFEHHVKLHRPTGADRTALAAACARHAAHLSRNAFRDSSDFEERFVTLRGYHIGAATAAERLTALLTDLHALGETVLECESEYCVFDTNLDLDAGWLPDPTPEPEGAR